MPGRKEDSVFRTILKRNAPFKDATKMPGRKDSVIRTILKRNAPFKDATKLPRRKEDSVLRTILKRNAAFKDATKLPCRKDYVIGTILKSIAAFKDATNLSGRKEDFVFRTKEGCVLILMMVAGRKFDCDSPLGPNVDLHTYPCISRFLRAVVVYPDFRGRLPKMC